jgi:hypothetical protein
MIQKPCISRYTRTSLKIKMIIIHRKQGRKTGNYYANGRIYSCTALCTTWTAQSE